MASHATIHPSTTFLEAVKYRLLKTLTLAVFFCLPSKLTNVFVSLSIVTMILKIRDRNLQSEKTMITRIEHLLKINLSENVLVLPDQTVTWFWTEQVLDKVISVEDRHYTLKDLLVDSETFLRHRHLALNTLLNNLPMSVQYKLKLFKPENRIAVKHNIISALMYA